MGKTDILVEADRVGLIKGKLSIWRPLEPSMRISLTGSPFILIQALGPLSRVRVQNPLWLDEYSEPEPDLAVVASRSYANEHPKPRDVLLVVEMSDSTLRYKLEIKVPLYAMWDP